MSAVRSRYKIEANVEGFPLVIRDIGFECMSVTNDVENVVEELVKLHLLDGNRPLYYIDSDGKMDEILIKDGKFADFRIL
jgi:hypothetical protein